jgi:1-acyl-sn-glycerol-3-phosphate acyltransferase
MAPLRSAVSRRLLRLPFPFSAPTVPGGVEAPPRRQRAGADYDTTWARRYPARLARAAIVEAVARPAVAALARPERHGLDRLTLLAEAGGPVVFAANHHSHVDTPLLVTSIPEPWRHKLFVGAAADYFFRTPATSALSALALGAIPIERAKVGRRSADRAAALLSDGWSMLIFPEGGRSPDGWGQPFRGGAAYLAVRCGVPVVPVHIDGTGRILRPGHVRPPAVPGPGRRQPPVRRGHRACRRRPGRRGHHRLVVGPAAGARRRVTGAGRAGRTRVAPGLGARRPRPEAHPAAPPLARALAAGRGDRPPPCRRGRGAAAAQTVKRPLHHTRPSWSRTEMVTTSSAGLSSRTVHESREGCTADIERDPSASSTDIQ